jgi:predicted nucleic acid-binding protein
MSSTSDRFFLDTNVLVYANDRSSPAKRQAARALLRRAFESRLGCLSTQVLQEFFVAVTRKAGVPPDNARAQLIRLAELHTILIDREIILAAVDLHWAHRLSFWDALIVRSASAAGCRLLYSEDLRHDSVLDGVRIVNPFR